MDCRSNTQGRAATTWKRLVSRLRLGRDDMGAVTAEFATVLPAVVVIALVLMSLARAVAVSMDCQDAASTVAREMVASRQGVDAVSTAREVAGPGASATVARADGTISVTVYCPLLPGPGNVLPARVHAKAVGIEQ
jgi:Flp pilus assembly protein TadG